MKYWILFTHIYCPMCGKETTYRDRMYTEKPKDSAERHKIEEQYDYCSD